MYKEHVHARAVLYSSLNLPIVGITAEDLNCLTREQALKVLTSGKVTIHPNYLEDIKPEILKLIQLDQVKEELQLRLDHALYVIKHNPDLAGLYAMDFVPAKKYNYELLACLIEHEQVDFHDMYICHSLADHLVGIKKYLPDFQFPDCYLKQCDSGTSLSELTYCIERGLYPVETMYPYDINDRDQFYQCINYLTKECIVETYFREDWDLRNRALEIGSCDITPNLFLDNGERVDRLYSLGSEWWNYTEIDSDIQLSDLTDEQLIKLSKIHSEANFEIEPWDFHSLVLYYEFFDHPKPVEKLYVRSTRDLLPYKKGLYRLWKDVANKAMYVKLYCDHVPSILTSLEPQIDPKFYKFMDKQLVQRISRKVCSDGSDIIITCLE